MSAMKYVVTTITATTAIPVYREKYTSVTSPCLLNPMTTCFTIILVLMRQHHWWYSISVTQLFTCECMISVKTKFEAKYHEDQQKHTISITNLVSVTEACCDDKAESHKGPIDFRNINLALELVRGMYNLNMWKTAQSSWLFDNWECGRYDGLQQWQILLLGQTWVSTVFTWTKHI